VFSIARKYFIIMKFLLPIMNKKWRAIRKKYIYEYWKAPSFEEFSLTALPNMWRTRNTFWILQKGFFSQVKLKKNYFWKTQHTIYYLLSKLRQTCDCRFVSGKNFGMIVAVDYFAVKSRKTQTIICSYSFPTIKLTHIKSILLL
jgi:hypothetical protein